MRLPHATHTHRTAPCAARACKASAAHAFPHKLSHARSPIRSAVAMAPKVEFPILGGVYWGTPQTVNKAPGDIAGACRVAKICGRPS